MKCCNPKLNGGGGWGVFNSLLGWQNSATYGSVISYNLYWIVVVLAFLSMRYKEKTGRWPLRHRKESGSVDNTLDATPEEIILVTLEPKDTK